MSTAKIQNVSGVDRDLFMRRVFAGQVIEVPVDQLDGLLIQPANWAPADAAAKKRAAKLLDPPSDEQQADTAADTTTTQEG